MKLLTTLLCGALLVAGVNRTLAETQDRHLSGFHAISSTASFDIYITQGASESVKVVGPSDVINRVITEVKGGELIIRAKNGSFNWGSIFNSKKVVVYVSLREINSLSISGSGDTFFKDGLHANRLDLRASGSGDITGKLNAKELNVIMSGSGDTRISGNAGTATVSCTGSGDYTANNLVTSTTRVRLTGSGDAKVNVTQRLDAQVSGSGDISYTGGAKQVSTRSTGSGDIHRF